MRSTSSEACSIRCSISGLQRSGGTGEHSPDEEQQARRGIGGPRISSSHHAFTQPLPPASAPAASCQTAYPCLATLPAHLCPCLRASLPASPAALRAHLKWRMRPCTGQAAASPSAQMVCPSMICGSSSGKHQRIRHATQRMATQPLHSRTFATPAPAASSSPPC